MLDGGVAQAVPSSPTDPLTRPDTMTRSHPHTSLYRSNLYILFEIGFCLLFNYFRPPTLIRWNIETREYFAVASLTSSLLQNYLEADYAHPMRLLLKGNLTLNFVMIIILWYKVLFGELPLPAKTNNVIDVWVCSIEFEFFLIPLHQTIEIKRTDSSN